MPTYDYRCPACALQFEAHHALSAPAPDCPNCGAAAEKVILSAPATHGRMARGRELAVRSLAAEPAGGLHAHGPGCRCGAHHHG